MGDENDRKIIKVCEIRFFRHIWGGHVRQKKKQTYERKLNYLWTE